jgi:uncharacterized membrane protein YraQ (UPF0718 family)
MTAVHHLALSLAALAAAPLLYQLGRAHRVLLSLLDGFVLAGVSGLVLLHVLPHTLEEAGVGAVVAALAGLLVPYAAERLGRETRGFTTPLALVGLGLHAMMDGGGLAGAGHEGPAPLATAIVLHRLPVGMLIWWLVRPRLGAGGAALILGGVGGATVAGFFGAAGIEALGPSPLALFEAAVAGMLTHVLVEHGPLTDEPDAPRHPLAETAGAAVGVLGLLWLPVPAAGSTGSFTQEGVFAQAFLHLALDAAPALLAGYVLAGAAVGLLTPPERGWLAGGGRLGQALRGLGFGLPRPICSCEVLTEYEGLVEAGVKGPGPLAFLLGGPGLRLEALPLSALFLGLPFTALRYLASATLGVAAALTLERGLRRAGQPAHDHHHHHHHRHPEDHPPAPGRLACALRFGGQEVASHTAAWVIAGLGAAALLDAEQVGRWLAAIPAGWDVPLFAALGLPLYVCASGATPLAAALIFAGASPGAALAFLLTGPAHDVATATALGRRYSARAALTFAGTVSALAVLLGLGANLVLDPSALPLTHGGTEAPHGPWAYAALAGVGLLFAGALLRHGPRRLLKTIISGAPQVHAHHHHPHEHG